MLEWHVIGMFASGFFSGHLIKRFGSLPVMAAGVVLNLACVAIAVSGIELHNFAIALFLLGVGCNFLLFAVMAISSLSSDALVSTRRWTYLNFGGLPLLLLVAAGLLWLGTRTRKHGELEDKLTFLKAFVRKRCKVVEGLVIGAFNEDVQSARVGAGFHDGGGLPGRNCRCPAARAQRR